MMKTEWDLTHLYRDNEAWETDVLKLEECLKKLEKPDFTNYQEMNGYLQELMDAYTIMERVYCYPKRCLDLNNEDDERNRMMKKAIELYNHYLKILNDVENLIVTIPRGENGYWKRFVDLIWKRKNHILENSDVFAQYNKEIPAIKKEYRTITEHFDFPDICVNGKIKSLTRENYNLLLDSAEEDEKKNIYQAYMKQYEKSGEIIANLYKQKLKMDIALASEEKYDSLLAKRLNEEELDSRIVTNLIETVNEHLPLMHAFVKLKKNIKQGDYHLYDKVEIGKIENKKISFEEAISMVKESLQVLGSNYLSLIDEMVENGWIDVYPHEKKRAMSSTSISYNGVPYILLQYSKSINGVRTLAHEIGHAEHVYESKKNNKIEYFEFSLFLTEIVAKVNELLFNEYLLKKCTSLEEEKYILNNIVSSLGNSLFGQMMLTEFEHNIIQKLHNKEDMTYEEMKTLYLKLVQKYNGDVLTVDDYTSCGFLTIAHFILQDSYYMYQYSMGLAIATNIAYKLMNGDDTFKEKYKTFLGLGNTVSVEDALETLGININDNQYLNDTFVLLEEKVKKLKKLCNL